MKTIEKYELADTAELMVSKDYKDRFVAEYLQLKTRIEKLDALVAKMNAAEAVDTENPDYEKFCGFKPTCPTMLLEKQFHSMTHYLDCLKIRAKLENIDLDDLDCEAPKTASLCETEECGETPAKGFILITTKGEGITFLDCGDDKTFISEDILFKSVFNYEWEKEHLNVYEGSRMQKAVNKWFEENVPQEVQDQFEPDLLSMTEIFGKTQENGNQKFWPDEPYQQLPLFKDWRNRTKSEANGNCPIWWLTKSPYSDYADHMCGVYSNGSASHGYVGGPYGVALCLRRKGMKRHYFNGKVIYD